MHWALAIVGAILGLAAGSADAGFAGLCLGALAGWQIARVSDLNARLDAIERATRIDSGKLAALASLRNERPTAADAASVVPAFVQPERESARPAPAEGGVAEPGAPIPAAFSAPSAAPAAGLGNATAQAEVKTASTNERAAAASSAASHQPPPLPPARPAAATVDTGPDLADRIGATLRSWLFEGNVPVKLGVLLLCFGLAAARRYAVDQGFVSFPIELRLAGIAALAIAGLAWGWSNRETRPEFGLALQGGALGVLLLTVFASYGLYHLLPASMAFGLVVALVAGAALLAVLQNAVALAVLGFIGGYLAPVLISTGSGNHVALFSYYAVLNAAVFAIAWFKPWRALNLVGFAFTFVVSTMWGRQYYQPALFASVEPFLIAFFLFYVAIATHYAQRGDRNKPAVDGTLVLGTPQQAFPLQVALLDGDEMAMAWSAIAIAVLYAALAWWLVRSRRATLLGQSFAALALGFATLAVPLALSARWTSASWAVEGAALVWLGLRQRRQLPQLAGLTLQVLAMIAYFNGTMADYPDAQPGELFVLNGHALSVLLMAGSAFFISWLYERDEGGRAIVWPTFVLGVFWWLVGGLRETLEFFPDTDMSLKLVAFAAISALLAGLLRGWIAWPRLGWIVLGVAVCGLPLVVATEAFDRSVNTLPQHTYWLAWFAAMLIALRALRAPRQRGLSIAHVLTLFSAVAFYALAMHAWAQRAELADGWQFVAMLLPLIALLLATWRTPQIAAWPLAEEFSTYRPRWFAPAGGLLALAWIAALAERGGSAPLIYLPVLNPIELFQLGSLLIAITLARRAGSRDLLGVLAVAGLLFATFAALRAVHHFTGAPWSPSILDDRVAQATLTVVWSLAGVVAWIVGSRQKNWGVWLAGAGLMGLVLLKLLLVDRRYFGDLAGIVSFMAVGGLLVLVGRIAPTPPRHVSSSEKNHE